MGILGGVCRPILQILTLFQTKTCHFPYSFSDLEVVTKRNITCLHMIKHKLHHHCNWTTNTQSWFPRINYKPYPIPDQIGKIYTRFQTKMSQKTLPDWAAHTCTAYIRENSPRPRDKSLRHRGTSIEMRVRYFPKVWGWTMVYVCSKGYSFIGSGSRAHTSSWALIEHRTRSQFI